MKPKHKDHRRRLTMNQKLVLIRRFYNKVKPDLEFLNDLGRKSVVCLIGAIANGTYVELYDDDALARWLEDADFDGMDDIMLHVQVVPREP